jgi:stearoyl-CoA desaturase (Delta-9 desaturase)
MPEKTEIPVANPSAELPTTPSFLVKTVTVVVIVLPLLGVAAIPFFVWGWGFRLIDLWLVIGMYLLTTLGVTIGFHRLFVHRSFETYRWIQAILAICGSMAVQGSLFQWVGLHRLHHRYSDQPADPHTPHHHGEGLAGLLRGFWHAHIGWFFDPTPDLARYVKDLAVSPTLRWISATFALWVALGLALPAAIGWLVVGDWSGAVTGLIWGGLVRIFLVHHVTWSVNSACHLWGRRTYVSGDESRNNPIFGYLALGEGWHNTHHAFPTSARHGLRWWQFDLSYRLIQVMAALGLAWKLKIPSAEVQQQARTGYRGPGGPLPHPG